MRPAPGPLPTMRHDGPHPAGAGAGDDDDIPDEQAPLLNPTAEEADLPPSASHLASALRFRVLMFGVFIIFFLELGTAIQVPPINKIIEDILCRSMYPETGLANVLDPRCRERPIQSRLAMLRGWSTTFDCLPGLLCAVPYGILSDRWGRRPVLMLGIAGTGLSMGFSLFVFVFSDYVPIEAYWFASAFFLIGGGGQVIIAMVYTFLADVTPTAERATTFFRIGAVYLTSQLVANLLAGILMDINPWIPLVLGLVIIVLCLPASLALPETLHLHIRQDEQGPGHESSSSSGTEDPEPVESPKTSVLDKAIQTAKHSMVELRDFVVANKTLTLLLISILFGVLGKFVSEMLLQYAAKRYEWSWAKATKLLTVRSAASLVVLLAVLPSVSWFCSERLGWSSVAKDIRLARLSGVLQIWGCLVIAAASNGWILMVGLVWFSLGIGMQALTRSLVNGLVEQRQAGTVNTLISLMEFTGIMIAGPLLAKSWDIGLGWGPAWYGLPFISAAVFTGIATGILLVYRPPGGRQ